MPPGSPAATLQRMLRQTYAFALDDGKDCGLCMQERANGAIEMRPEPI